MKMLCGFRFSLKNIHRSDCLKIAFSNPHTCVWKAMLKRSQTILSNQGWVVGNGEKIRTFEDRWVPNINPLSTYPLKLQASHLVPNIQLVSKLIKNTDNAPVRDAQLLHQLWNPDLVHLISSIPLGASDIQCKGSEPAGTPPNSNLWIPSPLEANMEIGSARKTSVFYMEDSSGLSPHQR